jgi:ribose 5-phosphate isomerase B
MIYIASDHGGLYFKKGIINFLRDQGIKVEDLGPVDLNQTDDYPDYIIPLAIKMQSDKDAKGIVICRNGVGVNMLANRYPWIRAGLSWSEKHAVSTRKDDDTNVLALPADYVDEKAACGIVKSWLNTPFSTDDKYLRRLKKFPNYDYSGNK